MGQEQSITEDNALDMYMLGESLELLSLRQLCTQVLVQTDIPLSRFPAQVARDIETFRVALAIQQKFEVSNGDLVSYDEMIATLKEILVVREENFQESQRQEALYPNEYMAQVLRDQAQEIEV